MKKCPGKSGCLYPITCGAWSDAGCFDQDVPDGVFSPTAENARIRDAMAQPTLISEREKTHGPFDETARIYCELIKVVRPFHEREDGTYEIGASLDMILMKLARIGAGNAMHEDHWQDIIGYSELALASIRRARA